MFYSAQTRGFYTSSQNRPSSSVEVTEEEYAALLAGENEGKVIVPDDNGKPVLAATEETLDEIKARLCAAIDSTAERERLKYITPGSGQAMTYSQKAGEAARYLAATDPDAADYPLINAEVGITAETLAGVADVVNAAHETWLAIGAAIESARLGTKMAIEAATTAEEARAAAVAVAWPED